jgi:Tfp pilus assembly protein PilN
MTAVRGAARGFNLLPHRQRDARRARRRRQFEWMGAALCGCVAVAVLAGWQAFERTRLDRQRAALEQQLAALASPLAEHARLTREAGSERERNERAAALAGPLSHLLDLFDALSRESSDAIVVRQLRHRERETELLAASTDHAASAAWLNRLAALRGVQDADLSNLRPAANVAGSPSAIDITAHLKWDGPPEKPKGAPSAQSNTRTRGKK